MNEQVQNFGFQGTLAEQLQLLPGFALSSVHMKVAILWRLPFLSMSRNKFTMKKKNQPIFLKCIAFSQFSPQKLQKNINELVTTVQGDSDYIKNLFPKEALDTNHKRNLVLVPIIGLLAGSLDIALIERVWNSFCGESSFDPLRSVSEAIEEYIQWHTHKPPQDKVQLLKSCFTNPSLLYKELDHNNEKKWMRHEWYPEAHGKRNLGPWGNSVLRLQTCLLIGIQVDPRPLIECAWGITRDSLKIEVANWFAKRIATKSGNGSASTKRLICLPGFASPSRYPPARSKRRPNTPLLQDTTVSTPLKQAIKTPDTEPTTIN
jgi:hypothetical protein